MSIGLIIHLQQNEDPQKVHLSGFAKASEGSRISYHSHHPEAEQGLLLRANSTCNSISWQSDRVPSSLGDEVTFLLVCAIAGSKGGGHSFDISADKIPLGSIASAGEGETPQCFSVPGRGVSIKFEEKMTDHFSDHFGLLCITLPTHMITGKDVLSFEIACCDDNSEDWLIVFAYQFAFQPRIMPEPILKNVKNKTGQIIKVIHDNHLQEATLHLKSELEELSTNPVLGANVVRIAVPAVSEPMEIPITYYLNELPAGEHQLLIKPVTPRKIYILPFSHNDIGYTDQQENVRNRQHQNIETALEQIGQTSGLGYDAQARWNLEVIWALESWWKDADDSRKTAFLRAVQSEHIGLNALHNNLLTGLCNEVELHRHLDIAREFYNETGFRIETAAVTDIPGFVWSLVDALAAAGVKYFAIAPNNGDRVGHIYDLADQPFYWSNPQGTAKVLTWIFGAGYAMFHRESITSTGLKKALNYLSLLEDRNYPYSLIPLAYTIGGDNGTPDAELPGFVQSWNAEFHSPHFVISTHARFFGDFEEHCKELPVRRGDMTPYWEDGAASTAYETKLSRNAADRLVLVEDLFRTHFPDQVPEEEIRSAWKQVILYDEHTWGAWNSVSEPDSDFVTQQWKYKQRFALEADSRSRELLVSLQRLGLKAPGDGGFEDDYYPKEICTNPEAVSVISSGKLLENDWIALELEPQSCAVRTINVKHLGLILKPDEIAFFQYFYMKGIDHSALQTIRDGKVVDLISRDGFTDIIMSGTACGCNSYYLCLRVWDSPGMLEVAVCLDKIAIRDKESIHLAFPFDLEAGKLFYDGAGTWIDPENDLLPVACRNFFCPQRKVMLQSPKANIAITLKDNPLIEIGEITAELPWLKTLIPSTRFFAYLMNNYWHTNYKADQSGKVCFRFRMDFRG